MQKESEPKQHHVLTIGVSLSVSSLGNCKVQHLVLGAFTSGFNMPKFHVMKDFGRAICDRGNTGTVSTDHGEGTDRVVKVCYTFTNCHPNHQLEQVLTFCRPS